MDQTRRLRDAVGLLRETKNRFERRAALAPEQVADLRRDGIAVCVERSAIRIFADEEYAAAGANVVEDASDCRLVVGVKEVQANRIRPGQSVMCFSHTIKGQQHNMGLLRAVLEWGATLIDHEAIVDERGVRQVTFGRYAGLVGGHEALWALGHRMAALGVVTPLADLKNAIAFDGLADMVASTGDVLRRLAAHGLGALVVVVTGEGRVSRGALEYFDRIGAKPIDVAEAAALRSRPERGLGEAVRVLHLRDRDVYARAGAQGAFDFADFVRHPELYACTAPMYLPYARALVNGSYWDAPFPRVLDASAARRMLDNGTLPWVLADLACDLRGGIEWTVRTTESDAPAFVFDPKRERATVGLQGDGVAIVAVDNLPCALPRDASADFSRALAPFVRTFFRADAGAPGAGGLPPALHTAVVAARGALTDAHRHLADCVEMRAPASS
jgi:alpha-aminoadipic semialdehyde synthase